MKTALNYIKKKLLYPFKHDLLYFILLWSIISLPAFYQKLAYPEYFSSTLVLIFYAVTYILVFLLNLDQYVAKIFKPIVFVLYTILSIVNIYCIYMYNCWFSNDYVEIIKGTTIDETKEYLEAYISVTMIALAIFFWGGAIIIYKFIAKIKLKPHNVIVSLAFIPLFVTPIRIRQHPDALDVVYTGRTTWNYDDEMIDLRNHLSYPRIFPSKFTANPLVVIVIGESFTPSHSSLYGYEKATNPLLAKKTTTGDLVIFSKVTSPQTHTVDAFKYLLNTYQLGMEKQYRDRWYDSVNLVEVLNAVGYHTVWVSNQDPKGLYDTLPSGHAKLCEESVFMIKDDNGHKYDGKLLKCKISQKDKPLAVFYHLMGQHNRYIERYPAEYDIFKPMDYPEYTDEVAKVIAAYDNATLYNDYVINSLIEKYQNEDAVIFYLSDHGQDVYETSPNYYGHAKNTPESQIVGKKIPFMVYLSPKYQQLHPKMAERIKQSIDKEFCTDKLIYAVMDAIGCKFADNDDVALYSLWNKKVN